jgi:hypothetical protein
MKFSRNYLALGLAAALAFSPVAADAHSYNYFHHYRHMKPKAPEIQHTRVKTPGWAYYLAFAGGCSTIWLMLASTKPGGPSPLEAQKIVGNCFLPFIGGYLVEEIYKKNNHIP